MLTISTTRHLPIYDYLRKKLVALHKLRAPRHAPRELGGDDQEARLHEARRIRETRSTSECVLALSIHLVILEVAFTTVSCPWQAW